VVSERLDPELLGDGLLSVGVEARAEARPRPRSAEEVAELVALALRARRADHPSWRRRRTARRHRSLA